MSFKETCRLVFLNLFENKFKVFLTSLGIFVGTITIVLVIAIGKGGEQKILDQFKNLSAETIYVNINYQKLGQGDTSKIEKIKEEYVEQIMMESSSIQELSLVDSGYKEIGFGTNSAYTPISCVTENFDNIMNLEFEVGEIFSDDQQNYNKNVVIIGNKLAEKYFTTADQALSKKIKIENNLYTIVGVLKAKNDSFQGITPDDTVFFPYGHSEKLLKDQSFPKLIGLSKNIDSVDKSKKEITSTLNYLMEDSSVYLVEDAGSRIEAALSSAKTMNLLLLSVGTIVFVVGGIGIMNVLFLSVRERTKEIGILKALGCKQKDILVQFVLESGIISLLGGLAGVIVSEFVFPILTLFQINAINTMQGKGLAFIFAFVTGTLFGLYPAYKASKLKPIEALLTE